MGLGFIAPNSNGLEVPHRAVVVGHNPLKVLAIHGPTDAAGVCVFILVVVQVNGLGEVVHDLSILIR